MTDDTFNIKIHKNNLLSNYDNNFQKGESLCNTRKYTSNFAEFDRKYVFEK